MKEWILIICLALCLCGCAHLKYQDVEYWRLGKQEIKELIIVSGPNSLQVILRGHKGGESIKPTVAGLIGVSDE